MTETLDNKFAGFLRDRKEYTRHMIMLTVELAGQCEGD